MSLKPEVCMEGVDVDAAGISVKAGAQYPGRPEVMPARAMAAGRWQEVTSGVSRGHSSPYDQRAKTIAPPVPREPTGMSEVVRRVRQARHRAKVTAPGKEKS